MSSDVALFRLALGRTVEPGVASAGKAKLKREVRTLATLVGVDVDDQAVKRALETLLIYAPGGGEVFVLWAGCPAQAAGLDRTAAGGGTVVRFIGAHLLVLDRRWGTGWAVKVPGEMVIRMTGGNIVADVAGGSANDGCSWSDVAGGDVRLAELQAQVVS